MDDLLREFLTETNESLDTVDVELVRFEQEPNNTEILGNIFRLVHTIKGTCGFLGLPRLQILAHAAETLMGKFRDGSMPVTGEAVTLVLSAIDRIKNILSELDKNEREPAGADDDLIGAFEAMVLRGAAPNPAVAKAAGIVDIVEEHLDIQVGSDRQGILGSAVIRGQATEILDVGHFLPLAYEDWFMRKDMQVAPTARTLLLVDDSAFFRNMLSPVLKAAGYEVTPVPSAQEALTLLKNGRTFDVLVTDLDMPGMDGFALAEAVREEARFANMPIIALSSHSSPESIERGREVGFHDYVAKFDRQSLVAVLKEQTADVKSGGIAMTQKNEGNSGEFTEYVTVVIGAQLFGLPIGRVQDVFVPERLTRVPLAPPRWPAFSTCAAAS